MLKAAPAPDLTDGEPCTVNFATLGPHFTGPVGVAEALALGVADAEALGVADPEALGVADALPEGVPEELAEGEPDALGVGVGVGVPAKAVELADASAVTFLPLEPNKDEIIQTIRISASTAAPSTTARRIW